VARVLVVIFVLTKMDATISSWGAFSGLVVFLSQILGVLLAS
jgi:hypothetical protein